MKKAFINIEKCVGCGACILNCPSNAIKMEIGWYSVVNKDRCIGCGKCQELCHRNAIELKSY